MGIILALLGVTVASAIVCLVLCLVIRNFPIAVASGFIVSELLFLIYLNWKIASSHDAPDLIGFPLVFAFFFAPVFLFTSYTSAAILAQLRRRKTQLPPNP